jgi:alpha-L-fucosidase 2
LSKTGNPTPNITCLDNNTLSLRGYVSEPGLLYELIGRVQGAGANTEVACNIVSLEYVNVTTVSVSGAVEAWITWVGGTNYDLDAGDELHDFSFQGPDPHVALVTLLPVVTVPAKPAAYPSVLSTHINDYEAVFNTFSISLGQTPDLSIPTDQLKADYKTDVGNVYLEWLLFNYGRYLLGSSARGLLPANLQGIWGGEISHPWGAGELYGPLIVRVVRCISTF